jgi:hypothetical protein
MSDSDDPRVPAANRPTRSIDASRRLSQLLARPFGAPAPPGETVEPVLRRVVQPAPAPAPEPVVAPPDHTASAAPPPAPAVSDAEPPLPWFDHPGELEAEPEPVVAPEPPALPAHPIDLDEARAAAESSPAQAAAPEDDLFDRRDPPARHAPEPAHEALPYGIAAPRPDENASPREPERVPEWAWPSALERAAEPAAPHEALRASEPEPPRPASEPLRPAAAEPFRASPPTGRPLEPDAARTLGNIRRLMLFSNLFMVVAIGAVLVVIGYRLFRTEPAPPPPPPPTPKPALAAIPNDMTLTLPRSARIVQTAVAGDRLVITLQIDGATEIRTFDIKTLQPTGRMSFDTAP